MQLREYLDQNKITISDFARETEFTRTFLSLLLSGKSRIRPRTARLLASFTNGNVSEEEILSMNKEASVSKRKTKKIVAENRDK